MASVRFEGVTKLFGERVVVNNLSLVAEDSEFLVLVGPSGCGKTTSLRMLAGLETVTHGSIHVGQRNVTRVAPRDRDVAMVFQNYALFPHMSVRGNLAFGLKVRGEPRGLIGSRVDETAAVLNLTHVLDHKPGKLSGGERQRVALGRALLRQPQVFLMDEPLSNLDAALRTEMRAEIGRLHARVGVTTVYVTHDQIEALTMGDRIAVLRDGVLQQVDAPTRLYDEPVNEFVATFIGSPRMNLLDGKVTEDGDVAVLAMSFACPDAIRASGSSEVRVGVRAEDVGPKPYTDVASSQSMVGLVELLEPLGTDIIVTVECDGTRMRSRFPPRSQVRRGERVTLYVDPHRVHFFHPDTGVAMRPLRLRDGQERGMKDANRPGLQHPAAPDGQSDVFATRERSEEP